MADDYENSAPQNVPTSIGPSYREPIDMVPPEYPSHVMDYNNQVWKRFFVCIQMYLVTTEAAPNITPQMIQLSMYT